MALRFLDPCGLFYATTAQATSGLYSTLSASIATSGLPAGMIGSTALQNVSNATIQVPVTSGPYFFGCRFYPGGVIGAGENLFSFLDNSGQPQVTFQTNTNGTITAKRGGGNGTVLGTSSTSVVLIDGTACYIEFGCFCNGSTGTIAVYINGTQVLSLTAQNTQGQGTTNIGAAQFFGANLSNYVQDIYVCDSTTSFNNTFLGDVVCTGYNPNGTGSVGLNQYTPNGAATVYQSVAAVTPTDSTIFASDSKVGDRMSNTFPPTAATTILAVGHVSRYKKTASGTRTGSQTITSNGIDAVASPNSPGTSYAYYLQISQTDPNTGLPYTQSGFNQLQAGLETVS